MKKSLIGITVFAIVMASGAAFAAGGGGLMGNGKYGSAGCGLGSLVFENQAGPVQILAATTNGTSGSQTFGMTTGTSNCPSAFKEASNERLNEFAVANLDALAKDIARGQGESLDALAELMGISVDQRAETYAKLQSNFASIFTSEKVQAPEVVDNIVRVLNG